MYFSLGLDIFDYIWLNIFGFFSLGLAFGWTEFSCNIFNYICKCFTRYILFSSSCWPIYLNCGQRLALYLNSLYLLMAFVKHNFIQHLAEKNSPRIYSYSYLITLINVYLNIFDYSTIWFDIFMSFDWKICVEDKKELTQSFSLISSSFISFWPSPPNCLIFLFMI